MERQIDYTNKTGKCPVCGSYGAKETTRYLSWYVTFVGFKCIECGSRFDVVFEQKILGTRLVRRGFSKWNSLKLRFLKKKRTQNLR